jgi:hypothetical protein
MSADGSMTFPDEESPGETMVPPQSIGWMATGRSVLKGAATNAPRTVEFAVHDFTVQPFDPDVWNVLGPTQIRGQGA